MASDGLIYIQTYCIDLDEMVNVPWDCGEELPACIANAYAQPVPWRRVGRYHSVPLDPAPDPKWYARAQSDGAKNRVAQQEWYRNHPNLMARLVVTPPPTP